MRYEIQVRGESVTAEFLLAKVHSAPDEFCGNVDVAVTFTPQVDTQVVLKNMLLQVAGDSGFADILGYLDKPNCLDLTFTSEWVGDNQQLPESIEIVLSESGNRVWATRLRAGVRQ